MATKRSRAPAGTTSDSTAAPAAKRSKQADQSPELSSSKASKVSSVKGKLSKASSAKGPPTVELDVGGARYACLCTRDPKAADAWAAEVLKSVGTAGAASDPITVVGMDCEWAPPWHRGPDVPDRLATLQLFHHGPQGMRALVFAVVGLDGKLPPTLMLLLGDVRVAKLGANLAGDATRVVRDFGCEVRGIFDLSRLNKKPGAKLKKSVSLEDVVKAHCSEEMHVSKAGEAVRTSNWEQWPLTEEQVLYASRDAALSLVAFMCKFGMPITGPPALSKDASAALVDLDVADATSPTQNTESQAESSKVLKKPGAARDGNKAHFFQHMRSLNVKPPNLGIKDHPVGSKDALAQVCIVVSGTLDSFERSDFEKYVLEHGGQVSKSVTAKVTHLVTNHGEAGPSKLAKCKELGIPVVPEDEILKMVGKVAASTTASVAEPVEDPGVPKASKKQQRATKSGAANTMESSSSATDAVMKPRRRIKQLEADGSSSADLCGEAEPTALADAQGDAAKPVPKTNSQKSKATTAQSVTVPAPEDDTKEAFAETAKSSRRSKKASTEVIPAEHSDAQTSVATLAAKSSSKEKPVAEVATPARKVRRKSCTGPAEVSDAPKEAFPEVVVDATTPGAKKRKKDGGPTLAAKSSSKEKTVAEVATPASKVRKKSCAGPAEVSDAPKEAFPEVVMDATTPGAKKGKKDGGPTPPKKGQTSVSVLVELDSVTLAKAEALSMRSALTNLAGRVELQGKDLSPASLLAALQKTEGLVNPAKRMLLGI